MQRWMINCKEYAEMVSRCMDRPLSFRERMYIKIHQWICPPCKKLDEQFKSISAACRWRLSEKINGQEQEVQTLSDDTRKRIKRALKQDLEPDQLDSHS
ncbi:MAG: hypothetical protein GY874_12755 [Desulfobacteraceae bacterium]|nr:hypothetical protein [Desulfobacteraceae bacterium]